MECYTCLREMLPVVESVLATRGFVNQQTARREPTGETLTVMTHGDMTILLREDLKRAVADIEIYSETHLGVTSIHELLPPVLTNHQASPLLPSRRWRGRSDT